LPREIGGFQPVVIGAPLEAIDALHPEKVHLVDSIGIVTVHDGPSLSPGEIIYRLGEGSPGQR
jgi:hypothetical protein